MVLKLYVYAMIDKSGTSYEVAIHNAIYAAGATPSELAKSLQKLFQKDEAFEELQQKMGGHGAFIVFREPHHAWITPQGKLSGLNPLGNTKMRALSEEEIKEFLTVLQ